ncbi:cytochrome C biogenesis protein [Nocardioides gansuensis]|uniref:Cytochrome C biogenesis protein n=2 Tax=Nocardioides gansuensis TaxID=2138300 RepID=A0A2T8FA29_9ACTN|nr:cytochrome C biogenesis protein [Nocardioides gansuensis]
MRTALVLLLLLALAAIPGSVVPQEDVDALAVSRWQDQHPTLTPVYEKLGLFSVYDSVWFSAIYLLLMVSLVGCIVPRTAVYWRALRARPPAAPRHLTRLPEHATYTTSEPPEEVLTRAAELLKRKRYRVVSTSLDQPGPGEDAVSAEKGYLREAGNLAFHLSVLVVLVGFAVGGLFGYKGGVIVVVGQGFSNTLTQYDDFVPGSLFAGDDLEPFCFDVTDFDVSWLTEGPAAGQARRFVSHLDYREDCRQGHETEQRNYDLKVNHPLTIGSTEVFLIGHGYAPVITVRDGNGDVAYGGPTIFLPTDQTFQSFGVIKAPDAKPAQIGLEGTFYPTFVLPPEGQGLPYSAFGDAVNPLVSMLVYTGDIGLDDGTAQSVYVLDKAKAEPVEKANGQPFRVDLRPGDTVELPDGMGSVTFEGLERWNKIQISRTPGKLVALAGVVLALAGLLGSLFIRPRRLWVRARRGDDGTTYVEVAGLDRASGADPERLREEIAALVGDGPDIEQPATAAHKEQS